LIKLFICIDRIRQNWWYLLAWWIFKDWHFFFLFLNRCLFLYYLFTFIYYLIIIFNCNCFFPIRLRSLALFNLNINFLFETLCIFKYNFFWSLFQWMSLSLLIVINNIKIKVWVFFYLVYLLDWIFGLYLFHQLWISPIKWLNTVVFKCFYFQIFT
jgi:hypothetical protein